VGGFEFQAGVTIELYDSNSRAAPSRKNFTCRPGHFVPAPAVKQARLEYPNGGCRGKKGGAILGAKVES